MDIRITYRALPAVLLIAVLALSSAALCSETPGGRMPYADVRLIDSPAGLSSTLCTRTYDRRFTFLIGHFRARLASCRNCGAVNPAASCSSEPQLAWQVDWFIGEERIWSIEF